MNLVVRCPNASCRHSASLPPEYLGRTVHCPKCSQPFTAPVAPPTISPQAIQASYPAPAAQSSDLPSRLGRFVIRTRLGSGAFGTVYRAHDPQLDREVALKVPVQGTLDSPERVERFLREARAAAQLRHPHIVPVFEAGGQEPTYYIASAFIDGRTLAAVREEGGIDFRGAAQIVRELAEALRYAHGQGVVHRDVKPANVMLDSKGEAHLMDFGLAHRKELAKLTQAGAVLGTPAYMAPEQALRTDEEPQPASDQYSLGVVLYELLTGRVPFEGPPEVVLFHAVQTEVPAPRKLNARVPRDLETICLKALAKRPEDRYASCQELADDLRRWLEEEPIRARRLGLGERAVRWVRRNPAVAGLTLAVAITLVSGTVVASYFAIKARTHERDRALAQVDALLVANPSAVPNIISGLEPYREWVTPRLRELRTQGGLDEKRRTRASLALLAVDPGEAGYLEKRMLESEADEMLLIRDSLAAHGGQLTKDLWKIVDEPKTGADGRFRAACALAAFDPDNPRWEKVSGEVVAQLVKENPLVLQQWLNGLRPVKAKLIAPLTQVFRDRTDERAAERSLATNILADYAGDQPERLADLVQDADAKQFAVLFPKLAVYRDGAVPLLHQTLATALDSQKTQDDKERLAKRQANAGAVLLRFGQSEKVWPLLKHSPDPRARSYLIHSLVPLGADPGAIIRRLDEEKEVSIRRALLLCLGEFGPAKLSLFERERVVSKVLDLYRDDPDPGLHAAAEWLLRNWQQETIGKELDKHWANFKGLHEQWKDKEKRDKRLDGITELLQKASRAAPALGVPPQWYVNSQGQTMVVIPGPVEFLMGSPPAEEGRLDYEVQHKRRIGRTFALAAKSVTLEQYRQFDKGYQLPNTYTRMPDLPVVATSWHMAAAYCNWLSEQEAIPEDQQCYEIKNGRVATLKPSYLTLTGYRLPTEAEMEYGTRAGALTSRYYGETEALLPKYGWYQKNSHEKTWPVGSLKPNDIGFFDVHGNVFSWCQEQYKAYPQGAAGGLLPAVDEEDVLVVDQQHSRVLRGGSFYFQASLVRSAVRANNAPGNRVSNYGFRVARTLALVPFTPLPPPKGVENKNSNNIN